jgi:hypothetical protein
VVVIFDEDDRPSLGLPERSVFNMPFFFSGLGVLSRGRSPPFAFVGGVKSGLGAAGDCRLMWRALSLP